MDGPFIFHCPATGLNVQHIFDNATPGREDDRAYVGAASNWPPEQASDFRHNLDTGCCLAEVAEARP